MKEQVTEKLEEAKENLTPEVQEKIEDSLSRISQLQERGRKAITAIRTPKVFKGIKKATS